MPDSLSWPPIPRRVLRVALVAAYLMVAVAGWDVVGDHYDHAPGDLVGSTFASSIGLICLTGGAVAAVATVRRKWRWEFVAIAAYGGGLFMYSLADWMLILGDPSRPWRGPAAVSAVFWMTAARGAWLNAFAVSTRQSKTQSRVRTPGG